MLNHLSGYENSLLAFFLEKDYLKCCEMIKDSGLAFPDLQIQRPMVIQGHQIGNWCWAYKVEGLWRVLTIQQVGDTDKYKASLNLAGGEPTSKNWYKATMDKQWVWLDHEMTKEQYDELMAYWKEIA